MTQLQIFFIFAAAVTLFGAVMVVTIKNLVHAAFYLILTLLGVATVFVLLNATYLAVIQVLVYIGAIAILIIMTVMVTRNVTGEDASVFEMWTGSWPLAALIAILVGVTLVFGLGDWTDFMSGLAPDVDTTDHVMQIGTELVGTYVVPTILAGMLLLAAMVGAIMVAWPKKKED